MAGTTTNTPEKPEMVNLRYLGTSARFVDSQTQTIFEAGGKPRKVSAADTERLMSMPYEMFETV